MPDTPKSASSPVDVVYVHRREAKPTEELFFSLRSVSRHLKNFRYVWIVGDAPNLLEDPGVQVIHFSAPDPYMSKQHNQRGKLLRVLTDLRITNPFLLFNDDFYLMADADAPTFPYYRSGTLPQHIEWQAPNRSPKDPYLAMLRSTIVQLQRHGLPITDFEVHVPILFDKVVLTKVLDDFFFNWSGHYGLAFRSLYGNLLGLKGVPCLDVKMGGPVNEAFLEDRIKQCPFLSTGPGGVTPTMMNFLRRKLCP